MRSLNPEIGEPLLSGIPQNMPRLRGKVVSGRADFGRWIEHLSNLYEQKTGRRFYPGTPNVASSEESVCV